MPKHASVLPRRPRLRRATLTAVTGSVLVLGALAPGASADGHGAGDRPGGASLLISGSRYTPADITPGVTQLPPGCTTGCATATSDGTYPFVFNNDRVDGSFGISSKIFIDRLTPGGELLDRLHVPAGQLVTSFPSKSELALNVSTDGRDVSFMGYVAPLAQLDVSNSNTPGAIDPTNPVGASYYRAVANLTPGGRLSFTETNAYSGNNGRAAVLNSALGAFYTAGNAGNGANPQPAGVVLGAGAQLVNLSWAPESAQTPGTPTPVGSFNITQLPGVTKTDKIGKDDNFRGLTIHDKVVYYTKGSGGNGVNTVYFIDTTGKACPTGSGVPQPGAALPSSPLAYDPATVTTAGLPSDMCVLKGFPTTLAKNDTTFFPFGIWFAGPSTLYAANEGDGSNTYSAATGLYTAAAAQTSAGLQKWVLNPTTGAWQYAYTLAGGLNLGRPYTVDGYPTGVNAATGLPWAPAIDGLRNIAGELNGDGTATIYAVTSTVSGSGDQGADPNQVVAVTDSPAATGPGSESFRTIRAPRSGAVVRGVALAPAGAGRGLGEDRRTG